MGILWQPGTVIQNSERDENKKSANCGVETEKYKNYTVHKGNKN